MCTGIVIGTWIDKSAIGKPTWVRYPGGTSISPILMASDDLTAGVLINQSLRLRPSWSGFGMRFQERNYPLCDVDPRRLFDSLQTWG